MKYIKYVFVSLVIISLLVPVALFNFTPNVASEIDNRMLAENPFKQEGSLTTNIENYVNDRVGLRDQMILSYTVLNDRIFNKMVHPSYSYGKDGYVFGAGLTVDYPYSEYHRVFVQAIKKMQDYCDERGVPFLFVFNPAKPAVLQEYIANGINYDREWLNGFFADLDALGVRYVDNTKMLREKIEQGEMVFNKKYDANHWNSLGAYYGTKAMLTELKKDFKDINIAESDDIEVGEWTATSLLVSKFPINEQIPDVKIKGLSYNDVTSKYGKEIALNSQYRHFRYTVNENIPSAPKALVFQGSYMNSYGLDFFSNAFNEYISVHDYQNVINMQYYYNIFKPDCVVFEVAEYTFYDWFFSWGGLASLDLTPTLDSVEDAESVNDLSQKITVEKGQALTKIRFNGSENGKYAWLVLDQAYDMQKAQNGFEVTVLTEAYEQNADNIKMFIKE